MGAVDVLAATGAILSVSFSLEPLSVLVVDDQPFSRSLVKRMLRAIGIRQTLEAEDGGAALAQLQERSVDLAIVDWEMQPVDGLSFVGQLRRPGDGPHRFLPIIMLTAHTEPERVREARDAGVNDILAKPVSVGTIYRRVLSLIEHPRPFIRAPQYFGPDRRRRAPPGGYRGPRRRKTDHREP